MYAVDDILPTGAVSPGTNLIVTGADGEDCTEVADRLLAAGLAGDEPAIVATTDAAPSAVRNRVGARAGDHPAPLAVVSADESCEDAADDLTRCVASSADLGGVGLACSELLRRFGGDAGVRVAVDSLSDLVDATDANTAFRFLHVLTGRIAGADGLGVATLRIDRHDEQTCNTVAQLFDARVEIRRRSETRELRVSGLPGAREEWTEF